MTRRRFGTVAQLPSGKYRGRYTGPNGVRYNSPRTFRSKLDADAWLRNEERLIEFDMWTPPTQREAEKQAKEVTVGDWVEEWLTLRSRGVGALKPSTLQNYRDTLDRRVLKVGGAAGKLRDVPLVDVTKGEVAVWWDAINAQFDSPPYNHTAYMRLKTALGAAVDRELIPVNPCTLKAAKTKPKPSRKELPADEVMHGIIEHLTPSRKLIAVLTLFHGLRIGEALGLRRKDVSKTGEKYTVTVRGNMYRTNDGAMERIETPKTEAGYRSVPIFARFSHFVEDHLEKFTGDDDDAYLFTTGAGSVVMDTSFRESMRIAKERAGYKGVRISPHYGRVWLITALAEAGMPIPEIGSILGQVDLKTITETYMRASEDKRSKALGEMDKRLGE